jgi:hypothetical protein
MRHFRFAAVLAILTLTACLEPDPVPESNYGVIGLSTVPFGPDTILSPEAVFYRTGPLGLPTSVVTSDECQTSAFPGTGGEGPLPRFLGAGDSVAITTATDTAHLFPTVEANRELYALPNGERFAFHPGERLTITVPGEPGGFANGTISIVTAGAFTLGAINPSPPAGQTLDVTWSPAGDDSTKMLLSLQYAVGGSQANEQIFCSLVDDGAYSIPSVLAARWASATTGTRNAEAARWRVAIREVQDGVLVAVSAFEVEQPVD